MSTLFESTMTPATSLSGGDLLTLGDSAHHLVSWWKPLLLFAPFVAWAWLISSVFDKHAARFFLGREKWNAIHMVAGVLALAAGFLMPVPGIAGFLAGFEIFPLSYMAVSIRMREDTS